ncbi:MAG: hypothetical protein FWD09_04460 [Lentimicrobiaceae bacterium]|nr:hypothetical protein [Lentimicrobiaceae bacterium]
MNKTLKITLNILIFTLIAAFGYYMFHSMKSERIATLLSQENTELTFTSPYEKTNSFDIASEILCFDISNNSIYVALLDKISVFDLLGTPKYNFTIEAGLRDIFVENEIIYLLYPTKIVLYNPNGQKKEEWNACSKNSDYCALTTTKDYVFVTDAENKNIVQYNKQGQLVRFIKSPDGFTIPSYAFDIISINDTIYCSNSGRHKIESYTIDGEFIASFGKPGAQAGAFAGCCNPVYLAKSADGNILTSEKGNPRISCYERNGKFRTILFDSNMLGGGTTAYRMCVFGENIFIANGKTILIYGRDKACLVSTTENSCAGCPMREKCKK